MSKRKPRPGDLADSGPDEAALKHMREVSADGDEWWCYRNADMCSVELGWMAFLVVGPTRTFKTPPKQYPDTKDVGFGWRYLPYGVVDLKTGQVIEKKAPCQLPKEEPKCQEKPSDPTT